MSKMLFTYSGLLTGIGEVTSLEIPTDAAEVSIHIEGADPSVVIRAVSDSDPTGIVKTRNFTMVADGEPLPDNYVKYIATFPFEKVGIIHVIEVSA